MIDCLGSRSKWEVCFFEEVHRNDWVCLKDGQILPFLPKKEIFVKLNLLVFLTPIYCGFYMLVHAIKGCVYPIVHNLSSLFILLGTVAVFAPDGRPFLRAFFIESPRVFCRMIWTIVKTPFYCLALQFAAIYGLIWSPLDGSTLFGKIEHHLHGEGSTYEYHLLHAYYSGMKASGTPIPIYEKMWKFLFLNEKVAPFFLSPFCICKDNLIEYDLSKVTVVREDGFSSQSYSLKQTDGSWVVSGEKRV